MNLTELAYVGGVEVLSEDRCLDPYEPSWIYTGLGVEELFYSFNPEVYWSDGFDASGCSLEFLWPSYVADMQAYNSRAGTCYDSLNEGWDGNGRLDPGEDMNANDQLDHPQGPRPPQTPRVSDFLSAL